MLFVELVLGPGAVLGAGTERREAESLSILGNSRLGAEQKRKPHHSSEGP